MVAASEGSLDAIKILLNLGSELSMIDLRGDNALADAQRESRTTIISYITSLVSDIIIKNYCNELGGGLLSLGMLQALGSFQKRFADLLIKVSLPVDTLSDRMSFLVDINPTDGFNASSMQLYFSTQELYLHRIIDQYIDSIGSTLSTSTDSSSQTIQLVYLIFLVI